MHNKRIREIFAEVRAEIEQWPPSMKQLNQLRRDEVRRLDEKRLADAAGRSTER